MTLDEEVLLKSQFLSKVAHQLLRYLLARCTNANNLVYSPGRYSSLIHRLAVFS